MDSLSAYQLHGYAEGCCPVGRLHSRPQRVYIQPFTHSPYSIDLMYYPVYYRAYTLVTSSHLRLITTVWAI